MISAPLSLTETLLRAQSQFEKLINGASENTPATKFAEMAFMTAEVCILLSEAFAKSIEHRRENLLRAIRAMAGIFRGLERASLETTSKSPNTLGTVCGQCETAIYAFLKATEPDTQGRLK